MGKKANIFATTAFGMVAAISTQQYLAPEISHNVAPDLPTHHRTLDTGFLTGGHLEDFNITSKPNMMIVQPPKVAEHLSPPERPMGGCQAACS